MEKEEGPQLLLRSPETDTEEPAIVTSWDISHWLSIRLERTFRRKTLQLRYFIDEYNRGRRDITEETPRIGSIAYILQSLDYLICGELYFSQSALIITPRDDYA